MWRRALQRRAMWRSAGAAMHRKQGQIIHGPARAAHQLQDLKPVACKYHAACPGVGGTIMCRMHEILLGSAPE